MAVMLEYGNEMVPRRRGQYKIYFKVIPYSADKPN